MQMMEKIKSLTKFSKKQSELIKRKKDKTDKYIKSARNDEHILNFFTQSTIVSQVAVFAKANLAYNVSIFFFFLV